MYINFLEFVYIYMYSCVIIFIAKSLIPVLYYDNQTASEFFLVKHIRFRCMNFFSGAGGDLAVISKNFFAAEV